MPEFYKCGSSVEERSCVKASHFTGEVFEGFSGTISINMTVKDPDKVKKRRTFLSYTWGVHDHLQPALSYLTFQNSRTQLILQGTDSDVFSVEPQIVMSSSVIQLLVKKPQLLDYETKQEVVLEVSKLNTGHEPVIIILDTSFIFLSSYLCFESTSPAWGNCCGCFAVQVIATDADNNSLSSTATVTITIQDTNDNSPQFQNETYVLNVPEHSPVGTVISIITVSTSLSEFLCRQFELAHKKLWYDP